MVDFIINGDVLVKYTGNDQVVSVPRGIKVIEEYAFKNAKMQKVKLPEGITSIRMNAFRECGNLETVVIPTSVTYLGAWAFCYCNSLKYVVLPKNIQGFPDYLFYGCESLRGIFVGRGTDFTIGRQCLPVISEKHEQPIAHCEGVVYNSILKHYIPVGHLFSYRYKLFEFLARDTGKDRHGEYDSSGRTLAECFKLYMYMGFDVKSTVDAMMHLIGNEVLNAIPEGLEENPLVLEWANTGLSLKDAIYKLRYNNIEGDTILEYLLPILGDCTLDESGLYEDICYLK